MKVQNIRHYQQRPAFLPWWPVLSLSWQIQVLSCESMEKNDAGAELKPHFNRADSGAFCLKRPVRRHSSDSEPWDLIMRRKLGVVTQSNASTWQAGTGRLSQIRREVPLPLNDTGGAPILFERCARAPVESVEDLASRLPQTPGLAVVVCRHPHNDSLSSATKNTELTTRTRTCTHRERERARATGTWVRRCSQAIRMLSLTGLDMTALADRLHLHAEPC
jgi:hypothetical protein